MPVWPSAGRCTGVPAGWPPAGVALGWPPSVWLPLVWLPFVPGRAGGWPGARGVDGRGPGAGVRLTGPVGTPAVVGAAPGVVGAAGATGVVGADATGACTGAGAGAGARFGWTGPGVGPLNRPGAPGVAVVDRIGPGVGAIGRRVPIGFRLALGAEAADSLPALPLLSFSFSRRSTGGSTVEEAERTNSPMSFNIVRTVLLSTPSSFASS